VLIIKVAVQEVAQVMRDRKMLQVLTVMLAEMDNKSI
jgi:hypothetical protein